MESFKIDDTKVVMKWDKYWSEHLKKTESDAVQLNVTNRVLADNKKHDSVFKEINCSGVNNNFLDNITDNWKLRSRKNRTYEEAVSGTNNIRGEPVKAVQKIWKSALGKRDHKVVGIEV